MANQFRDSGGGSSSGVRSSLRGKRRRATSTDQQRPGEWWDNLLRSGLPDSELYKEFRMSHSTFTFICDQLRNVLHGTSVPIETQIAICLRRLAAFDPTEDLYLKFGISSNQCETVFSNVCLAIKNVLKPRVIQWPDTQELGKIKTEYYSRFGVPNIVGAMYTNHIPISVSLNNSCYLNSSENANLRMKIQGVVDHMGVFTDCYIVGPTCMSDYDMFEQSELRQRLNESAMEGTWVVGRNGFPLTDGILVCFNHFHCLTKPLYIFNSKVSKIEEFVEEAFIRLRARWSVLRTSIQCKLHDLPVVLEACCVLRNICEIRNDKLDPNWRFSLIDDEMIPDCRSTTPIRARQARDDLVQSTVVAAARSNIRSS